MSYSLPILSTESSQLVLQKNNPDNYTSISFQVFFQVKKTQAFTILNKPWQHCEECSREKQCSYLSKLPVNGKVAALVCCSMFIYRAILSLFSQVLYLQICFLDKLNAEVSSSSHEYYIKTFSHTNCDKAYRTTILTYS